MPRASSPSRRACVAACPLWVSNPASVTRATATPPGLASTWQAVWIALPKAPDGNSVLNARRASRCVAACTMSASTLRMCSNALLRAAPAGDGEACATQELIGVRERDRARAGAGERAEIVRADDDAVGGERARRRRRGERARQPAVLQVHARSPMRCPRSRSSGSAKGWAPDSRRPAGARARRPSTAAAAARATDAVRARSDSCTTSSRAIASLGRSA